MKVQKFVADFDSDKNINGALDLSKARRRLQKHRSVNFDFPVRMIESLDKEANRLGITRQAIIKILLAERLEAQPAF